MNLAASASQRGYAMAALLVAMAVMSILLSVALPTWNQMIRREKEEELIFRGNQYARAINFYQRKFANASPPNLDILVEQHMLRKKYKDPMSPDKDGAFQPLYLSNSAQGTGRLGSAGGQASGAQFGSTTQPGRVGQPGSVGTALGTTPTGGIQGVTSKNTGESLRTFNGKNHYNEWQFVAMQQSSQAGGGDQGGRAGFPGGPQGPGGRGAQGFPGAQGAGGGRGTQGFPGSGRFGSGSQPGGSTTPPPARGQGSPQPQPQRGSTGTPR